MYDCPPGPRWDKRWLKMKGAQAALRCLEAVTRRLEVWARAVHRRLEIMLDRLEAWAQALRD